MKIVAPDGAALHAAVIGARRLEESLAFYRDLVGLQVIDEGVLEDGAFSAFWRLPAGSRGRFAALAERGGEVGRIVLIEFEGAERLPIRDVPDESAYGLMNLNFYTADIARDAARMEMAGYPLWSPPMRHRMAPEVGSPTEVMLDGPDTLIINLVELTTSDPATRIGQMRAFVADEFGYNAQGFTPVVTTQHASPDTAADVGFYEAALGMKVLFSDRLGNPEQNAFSRYPEGSTTLCTFMQGGHMFGKVAINQPLDYPCVSMTETAVAPNIGYIAQAFLVPDLKQSLARGREAGARDYTPVSAIHFPGLGAVDAAVVRSPGSGALILMIENTP